MPRIYDYFRVAGAHDNVLDYADLFTITLRNDDVQDFDTRWDEILLSMTKIPQDDVLESLYKLRTRESDHSKTVLELYDMEIHQKISTPNYQTLKTMVKRSIDQKLRLQNFDARNERIETGSGVTNRRGQRVAERARRKLAMESKRTVFERRYLVVVSSTRKMSVQNRHPSPLHPLSHQQKEMVEVRRGRRASEAGVHLGSSLDSRAEII